MQFLKQGWNPMKPGFHYWNWPQATFPEYKDSVNRFASRGCHLNSPFLINATVTKECLFQSQHQMMQKRRHMYVCWHFIARKCYTFLISIANFLNKIGFRIVAFIFILWDGITIWSSLSCFAICDRAVFPDHGPCSYTKLPSPKKNCHGCETAYTPFW